MGSKSVPDETLENEGGEDVCVCLCVCVKEKGEKQKQNGKVRGAL